MSTIWVEKAADPVMCRQDRLVSWVCQAWHRVAAGHSPAPPPGIAVRWGRSTGTPQRRGMRWEISGLLSGRLVPTVMGCCSCVIGYDESRTLHVAGCGGRGGQAALGSGRPGMKRKRRTPGRIPRHSRALASAPRRPTLLD